MCVFVYLCGVCLRYSCIDDGAPVVRPAGQPRRCAAKWALNGKTILKRRSMADLLVIMGTYERASKEDLEKIFTKVPS